MRDMEKNRRHWSAMLLRAFSVAALTHEQEMSQLKKQCFINISHSSSGYPDIYLLCSPCSIIIFSYRLKQGGYTLAAVFFPTVAVKLN